MQKTQFSAGEMVTGAWRVFTDHFMLLFLGHLLVNLILASGPGILVVGPLWYGLSAVALLAVRGLPVKIDDLFSGFQRILLPAFFVGLLLMALIVGAGLLLAVPVTLAVFLAFSTQSMPLLVGTLSVGITLCLVPLCAVLFFYSPAFFILFDGENDALRALRASRLMVWNNAGQWLGLWAVLSLMHVAGLFMCCVGTYVVTPWMVVVLAMAYERERHAAL